ncbi:hypothetical protein NQ317_007517 [Molorchus minor]|uniref:F5/8 type C domain-containing protein n=1 Tax=Molorchus minor TaxID=1323400 RepID=A0ABQ9JIU5_9CUCU|nr:hypothetical protein NQ317_007517 [Molorchus minor]
MGIWVNYWIHGKIYLLPGNTNTFTIVDQKLDPPIIATKIRFLPYSYHVRTVCMRVELVGCRWTGFLVAAPTRQHKHLHHSRQKLDPPIIATKIRFLPYSYHVRTVCVSNWSVAGGQKNQLGSQKSKVILPRLAWQNIHSRMQKGFRVQDTNNILPKTAIK